MSGHKKYSDKQRENPEFSPNENASVQSAKIYRRIYLRNDILIGVSETVTAAVCLYSPMCIYRWKTYLYYRRKREKSIYINALAPPIGADVKTSGHYKKLIDTPVFQAITVPFTTFQAVCAWLYKYPAAPFIAAYIRGKPWNTHLFQTTFYPIYLLRYVTE